MGSPQTRSPIPITLVAAAARTTSSNSGNLKDTANNLPYSPSMSIYLNVTAYTIAAGVAATTDVTIDTSYDGGTTWFTVARFQQVTTSTATSRIDFRNGIAINDTGAAVSTTSSALARNTAITRDVRVAWNLGTSTTPSVSFGVFALCEHPGV